MLKQFEKYVFYFLIGMLALYIAVEVVTLCYFFFKDIFTVESGKYLFFTKEEGQEILSPFFSILIALELIDTLKIYLKENVIKSQHIIVIGLIAISRKLLVIDFAHGDAMINFGIAALLIGLALSYFLIKKGEQNGNAGK